MPTPRNPLHTTRYPLLTAGLRRYFYSGWAFLIPYLAAYLLYYVTKWPVNPVGVTPNSELQTPNSPFPHSLIPPLLHVYWTLHAIHVVLAGIALWSALRASESEKREVLSEETLQPNTSNFNWSAKLTALAPWLLLALLFYIPGVYLEWPSDPWEHLRRINEWRILDTVGAHSSWMKSAYFIPYSLLSWCIGLRQLFWLDFYYTGICLLLCWQYYRFSRACGLGERASLVFVIIQALLFGNNIFSFYRYYGISSSIYAQLGAVALTRIVLEFAARGTALDPFSQKITKDTKDNHLTQSKPAALRALCDLGVKTDSKIQSGLQKATKLTKDQDTPLALGVVVGAPCGQTISALPCSVWHLPSALRLLPIALCLLPFIAFNHVQGLGIAALGIAAIIVWRLIEWKRTALWWLIAGTIVINALFLWLYPRPAIIETYQAQGWLNAWYGFNILDLSSPAGDRMLQIISSAGLANIAIAIFLITRNRVTGWLTLTPVALPLLPIFSVAFATIANTHGREFPIAVFQRYILASPPYIAILGLLSIAKLLETRPSKHSVGCRTTVRYNAVEKYCVVGIMIVVVATMLIPQAKHYNRTFGSTSVPARDLQMKHVLGLASFASQEIERAPSVITTFGTGTPLRAAGTLKIIHSWRRIGEPCSYLAIHGFNAATYSPNNCTVVLSPKNTAIFTAKSTFALLSTHWPPQQVACEHVGICELLAATRKHGYANVSECTDGDCFTYK